MSLEISTLYERRRFQRALSAEPVFASAMVRLPEPDPADIELIEACRQIVALQDQAAAIRAADETWEDGQPIEPLIDVIIGKKERLLQQIERLGDPKTFEGARALAAAAMSLAPQKRDKPVARDDFEWLLLCVAEFFTRGAGRAT